MIKETHIMYPISYVDDSGIQRNSLWTFDPSANPSEGYWVGEPIEVVVEHPSEMAHDYRIAKILKLREELAVLESGQ